MMAESGFNSIRIYTLHPPVFYEKLANYNYRNPDNPLLLFQGIWLEEIEDGSVTSEYDLTLRTNSFRNEIREVIDCIHGKKEIAFRLGGQRELSHRSFAVTPDMSLEVEIMHRS
jgi:hypothetical protein